MLGQCRRYGRAFLLDQRKATAQWSQFPGTALCRLHSASSTTKAADGVRQHISEEVRGLMRQVTQPVVLVTTAYETPTGNLQRGLTVSSFTTICLYPTPAICFSTRANSRAAALISKRKQFIVHLLPSIKESAIIAEAFSKSDLAPYVKEFQDPFKLSKWSFNDKWNFPVMSGALGALLCNVDKTVDIGDHRLLIAKVEDILKGEANINGALSYCGRKYRAQGDIIWPHDTDEDEE